MTNPMIERVARALCVADGYSPDSTCDAGVDGDPDAIYTWAGYRPMAMAAIAAMREPTAAMSEAGERAELPGGQFGENFRESSVMEDDAAEVWRAMIDEALIEE